MHPSAVLPNSQDPVLNGQSSILGTENWELRIEDWELRAWHRLCSHN